MKTLKKFLLTIVFAFVAFAMIACGEEEEPETPIQTGNLHTEENCNLPELQHLGQGKKIYYTTIGQTQYTVGQSILKNVGVTLAKDDDQLNVSDVEKGSVVVMVIGYATKAMENGITLKGEQTRASEFTNGAKNGDFDLIIFYLGKKSVRGEVTDSFLAQLLPVAKAIFSWETNVPVSSANHDGKIVEWAQGKPLYFFDKYTSFYPSLEWILK